MLISYMFYVVWQLFGCHVSYVSYKVTFCTQLYGYIFFIIYYHFCNVFICWKQINEMK